MGTRYSNLTSKVPQNLLKAAFGVNGQGSWEQLLRILSAVSLDGVPGEVVKSPFLETTQSPAAQSPSGRLCCPCFVTRDVRGPCQPPKPSLVLQTLLLEKSTSVLAEEKSLKC